MKKLNPVAKDMRKSKAKDFTAYERGPIKIHHGTWILIQLLRGGVRLSDLWMHEHFEVEQSYLYRRGAKQFLLQLEGHACPAFLMALRDQLNMEISDWRNQRTKVVKRKKLTTAK